MNEFIKNKSFTVFFFTNARGILQYHMQDKNGGK